MFLNSTRLFASKLSYTHLYVKVNLCDMFTCKARTFLTLNIRTLRDSSKYADISISNYPTRNLASLCNNVAILATAFLLVSSIPDGIIIALKFESTRFGFYTFTYNARVFLFSTYLRDCLQINE